MFATRTEAFQVAVFMLNRKPFHKLDNLMPDYSWLRSFGCICFPHVDSSMRNKLAPKARQCIFLGYSAIRAIAAFHFPTRKELIYRHVTFYETRYSSTPAYSVHTGFLPPGLSMDVIQGSKPRTYMDQSPILAAVDLSPVQPQSSSQQDLSQDYRPASVSSRLLSFIQRLGTHFAMKDLGDLNFFLGNRSQTYIDFSSLDSD